MKLITTEKAVRMIEIDNTLVVEGDKRKSKDEVKKEFEEMFNVKVEKVNTQLRKNKTIAYIKLNKSNPAIDVATKLGLI